MENPVPQRKFTYRGSVITIELTGEGDQLSLGADVHTDGKLVGRVALTADQGEGQEALIEKLSRKAMSLLDGKAGGDSTAAGVSEECQDLSLSRAAEDVP